ncbi:hypothetical protein BTT_64460 (plasmid) [Bacillus thuringiensis serovar morrisoni str. 4AA1]|uniref:DUF3967 domain-containing protein n=1 Tax=Bacillus TaxID=1386 RepID=UPI0005CF20FE|nr:MULTISPECIES: DUF3967 domain-containing protein [Bacillus]MED3102230.1 DUF3967 domain-containing protein [Bacillus thuringiensis]AJQ62758.1 hypothetical protein SD98_31450 [Bacillus thuringiensis serovar morrisoni]MRA99420.1 DUF3967 domain-containing protein [Bacillus thuringiensis]OTY44112.1 hypothetical protein BK736_05440 [Bacillus thuringiensis serovar poloniensis]RNG34711.1 DUF3967 domain-containing protein [Bacillus thuringiensis]
MSEQGYWSKEISELLQIGDSTLRKWCIALENQKYIFIRGRNNSRAFVDKDIIVLKRMKELVQEKSINLEVAAQILVAGMNPEERTMGVPEEERPGNYLQTINIEAQKLEQILEQQKQQEDFNKALLKKLEEQHKYFEERMNEREKRAEERDNLLLQNIREMQETKKLIAASEQKKKGFFSRLFRNT